MRWVHDEPSVDDSEKSVRRSMAQWILREDMRFSMHDKRTGRFIGGTGLHRPRCNDCLFEIGYWVRTSEANKGYVTEAVRALTRWAFAALTYAGSASSPKRYSITRASAGGGRRAYGYGEALGRSTAVLCPARSMAYGLREVI
jgi:hypothetical protein